jgi:pantoate--beta-alanine ligase
MTAIVRTVSALRAQISAWKREGRRIAFVPTMGDLHEGHLSLVRRGQELCERSVVSIFVNPTQFGPNEDFETYPRREAEDAAKLGAVGADLLYAPAIAEIYPEGFATTIRVGGVTETLEGAIRPGHFDGVATVVAKLLNQVQPDIACFGEKDYQQLKLVEKLVRDLNLPVAIEPCPIARDTDGLALSSRNRYLDAGQRRIAGRLNRILFATAAAIEKGWNAAAPNQLAGCLAAGIDSIRAAGFDSVDYLAAVDAETLAPVETLQKKSRLLVVARLGATRLLDNCALTPPAAAKG